MPRQRAARFAEGRLVRAGQGRLGQLVVLGAGLDSLPDIDGESRAEPC